MRIGGSRRRKSNPYGSRRSGRGPVIASRDAVAAKPGRSGPVVTAPSSFLGRGGPIGVVKLLRARGGCLGVIRWRTWKAAKCLGERPNARRSQDVRWRPREAGWGPLNLAVVAAFYSGFLIYEVNYDAYLNYGEPSLTVYGRYLFIVMAPVYVLLCHYLLRLFRSELIRSALALATALLFISYDFPWFLMHATPEWFEWMPR